jgi:hypothetical protein
MIKINWPNLFAEKNPNPDRDWRWLLTGWLVAVIVTLLAGALAYPFLFNRQAREMGGTTASSTIPIVSRRDLETVVKMIDDRANVAELLRNTPPNLVDPSR